MVWRLLENCRFFDFFFSCILCFRGSFFLLVYVMLGFVEEDLTTKSTKNTKHCCSISEAKVNWNGKSWWSDLLL